MKGFILALYFIFVSSFIIAQPPLPDSHGGWWKQETASGSAPTVVMQYFDNSSGTFKPYNRGGAPIGSGTALMVALLGGYIGIKLARNSNSRNRRED